MKATLKRLIALILAMAMSFSLLSANVWAEELEPLEDGSVSAQSNEAVTPEEDAPEEESVPEEDAPEEESAPEEDAPEQESAPEEDAPAEDKSQPEEKTSVEDKSEAEEETPAGDEPLIAENSIVEELDDSDAMELLDEQYSIKTSAVDSIQSDAIGETVDSGICGDNLTWELVKKEDRWGDQSEWYCSLIISGTGPMMDWKVYGNNTPWEKYERNSSDYVILEVIINEGVTTIGDAMLQGTNFTGSTNYRHQFLKRVQLPSTITSIVYKNYLND